MGGHLSSLLLFSIVNCCLRTPHSQRVGLGDSAWTLDFCSVLANCFLGVAQTHVLHAGGLWVPSRPESQQASRLHLPGQEHLPRGSGRPGPGPAGQTAGNLRPPVCCWGRQCPFCAERTDRVAAEGERGAQADRCRFSSRPHVTLTGSGSQWLPA